MFAIHPFSFLTRCMRGHFCEFRATLKDQGRFLPRHLRDDNHQDKGLWHNRLQFFPKENLCCTIFRLNVTTRNS